MVRAELGRRERLGTRGVCLHPRKMRAYVNATTFRAQVRFDPPRRVGARPPPCLVPEPQISIRVPSSTTRLVGMLKKSLVLPAFRAMAANRRSRQRAMPLSPVPGTIFSRDRK